MLKFSKIKKKKWFIEINKLTWIQYEIFLFKNQINLELYNKKYDHCFSEYDYSVFWILIREDQTTSILQDIVGYHRILLSESDAIRLSENVGNRRISPVSDCRIMPDFLGSDGVVSTWVFYIDHQLVKFIYNHIGKKTQDKSFHYELTKT
jgi:hypothetical protein